MSEALFGLVGVLLGSAISWFQSHWSRKTEAERSARYLAIRIVCILDKYMEDCTDVVKDDGLNCGQRDAEGCLEPQVKIPPIPIYPNDVDWKSIDHDLMYRLLSFPAEIEDGNRMIAAAEEIAYPPDYAEWFDQRRFYYSGFGLAAHGLSQELSKKYGIKPKAYLDWDPVAELKDDLERSAKSIERRTIQHQRFIEKHFGTNNSL